MFSFAPQIDALKTAALRVVIIGGTTLIGLVWLSVGLFHLLTRSFGPTGAGFALSALFLLPLIAFSLSETFGKKQVNPKHQTAMGQGFDTSPIMAISRIIESLSNRSPILAAAVAVFAGFLATRFPSFLNVFSQIITSFIEDLNRRTAQKNATPDAQNPKDIPKP
jgi:hypothetical protein